MWAAVAVVATLSAMCIGWQYIRKLVLGDCKDTVTGRHVLITGGSEGIGLELAKLCASRGAKVSLIARTLSKLEAGKAAVLAAVPNAEVAVQTGDAGDRSSLAAAVRKCEATLGAVHVCIAAAGSSIPKYFEDLSDDDFDRMLKVNYLGVVNIAKEVLPGMAQRDAGHFCAVCSMAAAVPFVGYAAYAPAKAACRSFLDVLRNEFADTGVQIHIAFPPDTDTPGFAKENETKPYETSHIWPECFNEVFPAAAVAEALLDDMLAGEYFLRSPDLFGNFLVARAWGHFPRAHPLLEACLAPIFVGLHGAMVWMADRAVRKQAHHKQQRT
eukprot:gb/GFBE01055086.1/.p1 GENE.gb/GFBE01055086.1/~~gb/GFBE01055086.1/.p1  ORF type:complete len:327 (+),score=79.63 gb/GFBE01055086.1/:1-981(+)